MTKKLPKHLNIWWHNSNNNKNKYLGLVTFYARIHHNNNNNNKTTSHIFLPPQIMSSSQLQQQQSRNDETISYLTAQQSQLVDDELLSPAHGFAMEQLMENAGISVAHAVVQFLTKDNKKKTLDDENNEEEEGLKEKKKQQSYKILIACGPGNNGGDGLVAARHLSHFGYQITIVYPRDTDKPLYLGLIKQCQNLDVPVLKQMPSASQIDSEYDLLVDSVFGFSFKGDSLRAPYDQVISVMKQCKTCPIMSVDVPSGWHVEQGNVHNLGPDHVAALVSLTAPKLCAKQFQGVHYLGGRFVPPRMAQELNIHIPQYQGIDTIVKL